MSVFISSLNSGSNGNCYYIGTENEAVLIDAGISCRETERRMKRLGLEMQKVKAVFISHEHTDHISGLPVLSKKYQLPVFITDSTQKTGGVRLDNKLVHRFEAGKPVQIGALSVLPFQKFHDAGDPHSFVISSSSVNIGVFTDIGVACKEVVHYFKQCHAAFLEANYDRDMLMNGNYPLRLKKRISGGEGHLSNLQALELFLNYRPAHMSHLILSHLSEKNNEPNMVHDLFQKHSGATAIIVASRYKETDVYHIQGEGRAKLLIRKKPAKPQQLKLF